MRILHYRQEIIGKDVYIEYDSSLPPPYKFEIGNIINIDGGVFIVSRVEYKFHSQDNLMSVIVRVKN